MTNRQQAEHIRQESRCWLGFETLRKCPNICKGECGYKPKPKPELHEIEDPQAFRLAFYAKHGMLPEEHR